MLKLTLMVTKGAQICSDNQLHAAGDKASSEVHVLDASGMSTGDQVSSEALQPQPEVLEINDSENKNREKLQQAIDRAAR